jgi:hypothetical protein
MTNKMLVQNSIGMCPDMILPWPSLWLRPGQKHSRRTIHWNGRHLIRDLADLDLAQYLWCGDWHGGRVVTGFGSTHWAAHYQAERHLGVTWLKLIIL